MAEKKPSDNSFGSYIRMFVIGMSILGIGFAIAFIGYLLTQK